MSSEQKSAGFLSYSREDRFIAQRIFEGLKGQGLPIFQDVAGLDPGEEWEPALLTAIDNANCLIVLLSPDSAQSDAVLKEVDHALRSRKPIIPAVIRGQTDQLEGPVIDRLRALHWLNLTDGKGQISTVRPLLRNVNRRWGKTCPVIAFSNLKGGVGKTTLAAQLSSALAGKDRYSILMIDLDPQANLTQFVLNATQHSELVNDDQSVLSLFEKSLVYGGPSPRQSLNHYSSARIEHPQINLIAHEIGNSALGRMTEASTERGSVFIIPGQFELVKYTLPAASEFMFGFKHNFSEAIHEARKEYDAIIIDLSPSSSFMINCALTHATHIICPVRPDIYSLQGLSGLQSLISSAFALSSPPEIIAILNGIPSWDDDYVAKVRKSLTSENVWKKLQGDKKTAAANLIVRELLAEEGRFGTVIDTHVPNTPMLQAYSENGDSAGFFALARHLFSGSYGARLANRLANIADEIVKITKLDNLNDQNSSRASEKTKAN